MTLVPLKLYFNEKGRAKLELALARGKKLHDKRETEESAVGSASEGGCCGPRAELASSPTCARLVLTNT